MKDNNRTGNPLQDVSDDDLRNYDFERDLHMGNIRVVSVFIELQRIHDLDLPMDLFKTLPDNTVGSLLNAINKYLGES